MSFFDWRVCRAGNDDGNGRTKRCAAPLEHLQRNTSVSVDNDDTIAVIACAKHLLIHAKRRRDRIGDRSVMTLLLDLIEDFANGSPFVDKAESRLGSIVGCNCASWFSSSALRSCSFGGV
jgi:hypothetical protein